MPASLESDVAVMYTDDRKTTSQNRISPTSHLSVCTITISKAKRETGTCSQVWEDTRTNFVSELEKGLFALLNWLFKLKWYKDGSTGVHTKSSDLALLHHFLLKPSYSSNTEKPRLYP